MTGGQKYLYVGVSDFLKGRSTHALLYYDFWKLKHIEDLGVW
jgi:hypothetical protein